MIDYLKKNAWLFGSYAVAIVAFWFIATPGMGKSGAYFGLVGLHLVFFMAVKAFGAIKKG